jgi:hypothetical protein
MVASAIGAMLMTGLTSVILTSVRATSTASNRIEASSQIRSFQYFAYDDFARSQVPAACPGQPPPGCLVLQGSTPTALGYKVMYTWDGSSFLDRQVVGSGPPHHVASNVTAFAWSIEGTFPKKTCVITLTVKVGSYAESQAFLFYPQLQ